MNHTTTHTALPASNPYAVFRQRIDVLGRQLDGLLSLICKWVLMLIPVLFAVAHIAATGETSISMRWQNSTAWRFRSMTPVCGPTGFTVRESIWRNSRFYSA